MPTDHRPLFVKSPRRESNPHVRHTKTASCHYITRAYIPSQLVIKSAQWESNPHVRHGKAIGYRYIMGAFVYINPTLTSVPGGNRTRVSTVAGWHVRYSTSDTSPTSTPHGTRTRPDGLRDHRPHPKSNGAYTDQWKRWESNPRKPV